MLSRGAPILAAFLRRLRKRGFDHAVGLAGSPTLWTVCRANLWVRCAAIRAIIR